MSQSETGPTCELCNRQVPRTTKHHLTPRARAKRKSAKQRRVDRQRDSVTVPLCRDCHSMVHAIFSEKELATEYNSIERLKQHEEVGKFLKWIVKQDPTRRATVRWTNDRRSRRDSRRT